MHKKSVRIKDEVVGKEFTTNTSGKCVIISYDDSRNVTVMFYKPLFVVKCRMVNLINGKVDNPFYPKHHNIGYMGVGKYTCNDREAYKCWEHMLKRAYDENFLNRHPTYKDVTVCEEWHNFQNFAKWYEDNYYEVKGERMELDKDILVKHNKIYSPDTCVFVPHGINTLFVKSDKTRGNSVIGTSLTKSSKYQAGCSLINPETGKSKYEYLGICDTQEKAFEVYKYYKERNIKEVADYYKKLIPEKLYDGMYNYEVEITD